MSIIREQIVTEALTWEHTPFAHFQCCKGAGVDCAHLIIGVGKAVGILPEDFTVPYYDKYWHVFKLNDLLVSTMRQHHFVEKNPVNMLPGDILTFKINLNTCHTAILLDSNTIIHARSGRLTRKVVRHTLNHSWRHNYLTHCFAYPMVGDRS